VMAGEGEVDPFAPMTVGRTASFWEG
jgi:hypothetical protein